MRKWFFEIWTELKEETLRIYLHVNEFYQKFHALLKLLIVAAFLFTTVNFFENKKQFASHLEYFDMNEIPSGYVVWVYPKDKSQNPTMPDSLKNKLQIQGNHLNYNIDVWEVGIYTANNVIVKVEVPDYAIQQFKLGETYINPLQVEEKKP
jgi:hypothetical protein